jgi:heme-degrading monooxygenase HmoA
MSFDKQIVNNVAPVVLISTFPVKPEHVEEFLAGFRKQFAIMRKQPGLISAQLHREIAGSCLFMNYVIWESTDAFKHGFESPEFQAQLKQYPPGTVRGNCLPVPPSSRPSRRRFGMQIFSLPSPQIAGLAPIAFWRLVMPSERNSGSPAYDRKFPGPDRPGVLSRRRLGMQLRLFLNPRFQPTIRMSLATSQVVRRPPGVT